MWSRPRSTSTAGNSIRGPFARSESAKIRPTRGVRVRLEARLGVARIPIHVDVGFGDVVSPRATRAVSPGAIGTKRFDPTAKANLTRAVAVDPEDRRDPGDSTTGVSMRPSALPATMEHAQ